MLNEFWVHDVTLTRYLGVSSLGDVYDDPEPLRGLVVTGERMYRAADGREKRASGTIYLPVTIDPPTLQSEMTCFHPGLHGKVSQVMHWDGGDLGLPECLEVVID